MSVLSLVRNTMNNRRGVTRMYCGRDSWEFDASATDGACPICGWVPEGDPILPPPIVRLYRWIDWDLVGLVALTAVMAAVTALAVHAANLGWSDLNPAAP